MSFRNLDALFKPRSIALVGASRQPNSIGAVLARNLLNGEFDGPVLPVNPHETSIHRVLAYSDLADLPLMPDLAVVATPPSTIPAIVDRLGELGTRGVVVISVGFAELGAEGRDLQQQVLDAAKPHLTRVVGPNCLGIMVPGRGIDASFARRRALVGDLASRCAGGGRRDLGRCLRARRHAAGGRSRRVVRGGRDVGDGKARRRRPVGDREQRRGHRCARHRSVDRARRHPGTVERSQRSRAGRGPASNLVKSQSPRHHRRCRRVPLSCRPPRLVPFERFRCALGDQLSDRDRRQWRRGGGRDRCVARLDQAGSRKLAGRPGSRRSPGIFCQRPVPTFDTPGEAIDGFMHLVGFHRN